MLTRYIVMLPNDLKPAELEIDLPREPTYDQLRDLIEPILGENERMDHVNVWFCGQRRDMFVSELGRYKMAYRDAMPRNELATIIYRTASLLRDPRLDPEEIAFIVGPAIMFDRKVWT